MPIARYELPDGRIARFEVPEGTTPEQAQEIGAKFDYSKAEATPPATTPAPKAEKTWGEALVGDDKNAGIVRTMFDQGGQGLTFGLLDEGQDRIGAGIASLATGEKYDDLLKEARGMSKARLARQFEQRPGLSIASNIAGGVVTGGAGAETSAGAAVANSLRNGTVFGKNLGTAGRAIKGAVSGAVSGGLYGAGSADDGKRGEGAEFGAKVGAVGGAAGPYIAKAARGTTDFLTDMYKGTRLKAPEEVVDFAGELAKIAGANYSKMRKNGATFNSNAATELAAKARAAVDVDGFIPEYNPKTLMVINKLEDRATDPKGNPITLSELDQYRRLLGRAADEDGVSAASARAAIDDFVNSANPSHLASGTPEAIELLNKGRSEYAKSSRYADVADVYLAANGSTNSLKQRMSTFYRNDNNTRGMNAAELEALKRAKSRSIPETITRGLGTFGFDLGSNKNVAFPFLTGAGLTAMNPVLGLATTAVGTASRSMNNLAAKGKTAKLLQTILERDMPKSTTNLPAIINRVAPSGQAVGMGARGAVINQTAPNPLIINPYSNESLPEVQLPQVDFTAQTY